MHLPAISGEAEKTALRKTLKWGKITRALLHECTNYLLIIYETHQSFLFQNSPFKNFASLGHQNAREFDSLQNINSAVFSMCQTAR